MTKSHLGIQTFLSQRNIQATRLQARKKPERETLGTRFQTTGRILAGNHTQLATRVIRREKSNFVFEPKNAQTNFLDMARRKKLSQVV